MSVLTVVEPFGHRRPREERKIVSLVDLAQRHDRLSLPHFAGSFTITRSEAVPLEMNPPGWEQALRQFGAPRECVENQELIRVRDLHQGTEATFNPLRGRRSAGAASGAQEGDPHRPVTCPACRPDEWHRDGLWVDGPFGEVLSPDGRVRARANWSRSAPISGIAFGDRTMHALDALGKGQFMALFDTAEEYIRRARGALPEAIYFLVFLNGGPRSGGSVEHAHVQVVGDWSRHFAYAEAVRARCPADYWRLVEAAHEEVGLTVRRGPCVAWASLVPAKERDLCAVSPTIRGGASFLHDILRALAVRGTMNYSLAAILAPYYVAPDRPVDDFSDWPPVLWRLVDRGSPAVRHGDIGCMELFGSPVISSDPFLVAHELKSVLPC